MPQYSVVDINDDSSNSVWVVRIAFSFANQLLLVLQNSCKMSMENYIALPYVILCVHDLFNLEQGHSAALSCESDHPAKGWETGGTFTRLFR